MGISLVLRDIVASLPFTDIAHAYFDCVINTVSKVASACACFHQQWPKPLIQIVNLGLKLASDGSLEILLDNADDANTNRLIKYVVTHSFRI